MLPICLSTHPSTCSYLFICLFFLSFFHFLQLCASIYRVVFVKSLLRAFFFPIKNEIPSRFTSSPNSTRMHACIYAGMNMYVCIYVYVRLCMYECVGLSFLRHHFLRILLARHSFPLTSCPFSLSSFSVQTYVCTFACVDAYLYI